LSPRSYFDETTVEELAAFEKKAVSQKSEELLPELNVILGSKTIANTWQASAAGIYRNLLGHICAQKNTVLVSKRLKAMAISEQISDAPYMPTLLLEDVG
jgi:hypothetical protein